MEEEVKNVFTTAGSLIEVSEALMLLANSCCVAPQTPKWKRP